MPSIHRRKSFQVPEREATPEAIYLNRRAALRRLGLAAAAMGLGLGTETIQPRDAAAETIDRELASLRPLPGTRNAAFTVDEPVTPPQVAAKYNNFYEFTRNKDVFEHIDAFKPRPWQLEVTGLCERKRTYDVDDLVKRFPPEERVYRFRCVEAWSMVVPWVGIPLAKIIQEAQPTAAATHVRFTTFLRPSEAPRQGEKSFFGTGEPWPYTEGLTLQEARNELTLLGVGMYGKTLARQHGAPVRLVVPWKYGFKNIKSLVKIEFTDQQPQTFWNTLVPQEYGFISNVLPQVPHPRWSQAFERDITSGNRKPTLPYNGYTSYVAGMYLQT
jgi:sulfoxide reductase catalytic subunit YedY